MALHAATQATVDLGGAVIQNGQLINLASSDTLDAGPSYQYAITGNCHGTGNLANVIPTGTSIKSAMGILGASSFASHLSGSVSNPGSALPVTLVNEAINGSFSFGPFSGSANADVLATITEGGTVSLQTSNVVVAVNGNPDISSIVFESGAKCVVEAVALLPRRPDISLEPDGAPTVGNNIYSQNKAETVTATLARGSSADFSFYVENDGSANDKLLVKAAPTVPGYKIQYLLGGTADVTASISTTGILVGLNPGQGVHVVAKVTVKTKAAKGLKQNLRITTSSYPKGTPSDQATYALKVAK